MESEDRTVYEPSASDPRIVAALDGERRLELAGQSMNLAGEEMVRPTGDAPDVGKVIRRRFTDIWRSTDAVWRLAVRQATVISAE